eukprot:scaffold40570_cov17-Tisochrysis_lutea.AAC.1
MTQHLSRARGVLEGVLRITQQSEKLVPGEHRHRPKQAQHCSKPQDARPAERQPSLLSEFFQMSVHLSCSMACCLASASSEDATPHFCQLGTTPSVRMYTAGSVDAHVPLPLFGLDWLMWNRSCSKCAKRRFIVKRNFA